MRIAHLAAAHISVWMEARGEGRFRFGIDREPAEIRRRNADSYQRSAVHANRFGQHVRVTFEAMLLACVADHGNLCRRTTVERRILLGEHAANDIMHIEGC
jgi:hypothetical protein